MFNNVNYLKLDYTSILYTTTWSANLNIHKGIRYIQILYYYDSHLGNVSSDNNLATVGDRSNYICLMFR